MKDIEMLEQAGKALFGNSWKKSLALALGVDERRMTHWLQETRPVPASVWLDIINLGKARQAAIDDEVVNAAKNHIIHGSRNMTNGDYFEQAHLQFKTEKYAEAKKTLDKINSSFNLVDDEFHFTLDARVYLPNVDIASRLEEAGTPELIAENPADRSDIKYAYRIRTAINVTSKLHESNDINITVHIDEDGKRASSRGAGQSMAVLKDSQKLIDKWLKSPFGNDTEY